MLAIGDRRNRFFRLTVPAGSDRQGKVLSVNSDGTLTYDEDPQGDDLWKILPVGRAGFQLVSARYNMALHYDPEVTEEEVYAVPLNQESTKTVWHESPDHEIYTTDDQGNRKYLWTIQNGAFVTPDEHVAERWTAVDMSGHDVGAGTPERTQEESADWVQTVLVLAIAGVLLFVLSRA